jgi:hypothetical protein
MGVQSTEEIKAGIIELCSEDDYGSWELWWKVSAQVAPAQTTALKRSFLDVVSELISAGKLIPKHRRPIGQITATGYDREKLAREVDSASKPDPDSYFWFGTE